MTIIQAALLNATAASFGGSDYHTPPNYNRFFVLFTLAYQDQAVTAADGTWTKDHKVKSTADAAAVLLLLLPHTLSYSFTLQDSLPPPPQTSRKLWPLLAKNRGLLQQNN